MLQNDSEYRNRNIEILRTPQYHPELQPIEKCWAVMKQYMGQLLDSVDDRYGVNIVED